LFVGHHVDIYNGLTAALFRSTLSAVMPRKMIPALPDSFGQTPHERFKAFAKAILAVPKSEVTTLEQVIEQLGAEKREIEAKIAKVKRVLANRKSSRQDNT
jgi:hypothetical protein